MKATAQAVTVANVEVNISVTATVHEWRLIEQALGEVPKGTTPSDTFRWLIRDAIKKLDAAYTSNLTERT